jgi:hypothetical protein
MSGRGDKDVDEVVRVAGWEVGVDVDFVDQPADGPTPGTSDGTSGGGAEA